MNGHLRRLIIVYQVSFSVTSRSWLPHDKIQGVGAGDGVRVAGALPDAFSKATTHNFQFLNFL